VHEKDAAESDVNGARVAVFKGGLEGPGRVAFALCERLSNWIRLEHLAAGE
jgi:hypothetical protein